MNHERSHALFSRARTLLPGGVPEGLRTRLPGLPLTICRGWAGGGESLWRWPVPPRCD